MATASRPLDEDPIQYTALPFYTAPVINQPINHEPPPTSPMPVGLAFAPVFPARTRFDSGFPASVTDVEAEGLDFASLTTHTGVSDEEPSSPDPAPSVAQVAQTLPNGNDGNVMPEQSGMTENVDNDAVETEHFTEIREAVNPEMYSHRVEVERLLGSESEPVHETGLENQSESGRPEIARDPLHLIPRMQCRQSSVSIASEGDFARAQSTTGTSVSGQSLKIQQKGGGCISLIGGSVYSADELQRAQCVDDVSETEEFNEQLPRPVFQDLPTNASYLRTLNSDIDSQNPQFQTSKTPNFEYKGRQVVEWGCKPRGRINHHIPTGNIYFLEEASEGVCVKIMAALAPEMLSFHVCPDQNAKVNFATSEDNVIVSVGWTLNAEPKLILYSLRGKKLKERACADFIDLAFVGDAIYGLVRNGSICVHRLADLGFMFEIRNGSCNNGDVIPWRICTLEEKNEISRLALISFNENRTVIRIDILNSTWQNETSIEVALEESATLYLSGIFVLKTEIIFHDGRHIYLLNLDTGTGSKVFVPDGVLDIQDGGRDDVIVLSRRCMNRLILFEMRENIRSYHDCRKGRPTPPSSLKESDFHFVNLELPQMDLGNSMIVNWRNCISAVAVSQTTGDLFTMSVSGKITIYGRHPDRPLARLDLALPKMNPSPPDAILRLATNDQGHYIVGFGSNVFIYTSRCELSKSTELSEPVLDLCHQESSIYILTESVIIQYSENLEKLRHFPTILGSRRLAVNSDLLFLIHTSKRCVFKLDKNETDVEFSVFAKGVLGPETVLVDDQGFVIIGDRNEERSRIAIFDSQGNAYAEIPMLNSEILDMRLLNGGEIFIHLQGGFYICQVLESQDGITLSEDALMPFSS